MRVCVHIFGKLLTTHTNTPIRTCTHLKFSGSDARAHVICIVSPVMNTSRRQESARSVFAMNTRKLDGVYTRVWVRACVCQSKLLVKLWELLRMRARIARVCGSKCGARFDNKSGRRCGRAWRRCCSRRAGAHGSAYIMEGNNSFCASERAFSAMRRQRGRNGARPARHKFTSLPRCRGCIKKLN